MKRYEDHLERARYIRTILAHHDHTQADLGRVLGISAQAAGLKLRGQSRFTVDQLLRIAEAYDLDPGHLIKPPPLEGILGAVRFAALSVVTMLSVVTSRAGQRARTVLTARNGQLRWTPGMA
jgi:transcriptional regulator with XRE-family HTH domain